MPSDLGYVALCTPAAAVARSFAVARDDARRRTAADDRTPHAVLEARLEAMQRRFPPNAHRLGELEDTAAGRTSVIRDVNVIVSAGKPWGYLYRMRDATMLVQRDLASQGAMTLVDDPVRQLPPDTTIEPLVDAHGRPVPGSHRFLPAHPFACTGTNRPAFGSRP